MINYSEIQSQVNKVIKYSQGISNPNTDQLMEDWREAKRDFIEAMGGKLIYEYPEPVSFELGAKEKHLRIDDFICMLSDRWRNDPLADFVEFNKDGFFSNQVIEDYPYNGIIIPKGMKLLKAFKYFESDTDALNDIQSAASMIIQEDKVEGILCVSVHPLDFLSSSENTHNWRSCHSLDGEYRAGNLSYMVDKTTVICYLRSKRMEKLPNFPEDVLWNSKKWRVLLYFSENWDMLFAGRQYPFTTESGLDFVKDKLLASAHLQMGDAWTAWTRKKIKSFEDNGIFSSFRHPYCFAGKSLVPINKLVVNEPGSLMFNDLLSSSCYDPVYALRGEKTIWGVDPYYSIKTTPLFRVGGAVKCCCCGKEDIELTESFMCNECEIKYGDAQSDMFAICPCCGHRYFYDDGVYVESTEEVICPDCAEKELMTCPICGDIIYKNDAIYNRNSQSLVCKWCYADLDIEEEEEEENND